MALTAIPIALAPKLARAQVTDADRNAARDLFNEGKALQDQGKYADALERFTRSLKVVPYATTTAFHKAQCMAALGQLVEAAEEFRLIVMTPLAPNASAPFVQAKQEAGTELQNLEPRIPKVKINVTPSPLAGLSVTVDGVPMSVALVGFPRPINPGSHRIIATAPGYSAAQVQVDVRERQQPMPEVTLTLQAGAGGVQYTTAPPTNPPPNYQGGSTYPPPQPYGTGAYPYNTWVPPRRRPEGPRTAFMIGVDAALSIPFGNMCPCSNVGGFNTSQDISSAYGVGPAVGIDVGFRLARILYLGVQGQGGFYGGGNNSGSSNPGGQSYSLTGILGLMSNPEGAGVYGEIGAGFRALNYNGFTSTGYDVVLGIGAQVKAGSFRIVPKIDLYVGQNDGNQGFHGFFTLGLAFFWELPLEKPVVSANATAAPAY